MAFSRKLLYKIYSESGTFLGVINDVTSDFSIKKEINGGDSEFEFTLSRKFDDFDENTTIKFNNRVKVYLQDSYHPAGDKLVAYGYIASYSPYLKGKEEGLKVTCLSAVSKLSNDFYRTGTSLDASQLGIELTNTRVDEMMEAIITHYRVTETNSMISSDFTNSDSTTDGAGAPTALTTRFFNMKHLEAIREAAKYLPKNKTGGYWQYWRIATDGKLWVKNLSTTADHSFIIGKHITEIDGEKSMMDIVNRVYFWNEKGTVDPNYINLTNDDATSQTAHDIMAEYLTDSKITNVIAAGLLTNAKLYDEKDPKAIFNVRLTGEYDLASISPGQTCTLLNAKNNPYAVGADKVLLIESIEYNVDSAVLSLSNGHVSFADIMEEERQRLDKQMTWFGYITQQLTDAQLAPANRAWVTTIQFSAVSGADAYRKVQWTTGKVYIPAGASGNAAIREIAAGDTGVMNSALRYIIYLDEALKPTTSTASETGAAGVIEIGSTYLRDSSKTWTTDQWAGYVAVCNGEKKIVKTNTTTILTTEENFITAFTGAYSIAKFAFSVTSTQSVAASTSRIIFANLQASTDILTEVAITPENSSIDPIIPGANIAKLSITADEIKAGTITADKIFTGALVVGTNVGIGTAFASASAGDLAYLSTVSAAKLDSTVIVGGYIKTSLLTADNITTGTLTGVVVQTALSGRRIVLTSSLMNIYNESSQLVGSVYGSGSGVLITTTGFSGGNIYLDANSSGTIALFVNTATRAYASRTDSAILVGSTKFNVNADYATISVLNGIGLQIENDYTTLAVSSVAKFWVTSALATSAVNLTLGSNNFRAGGYHYLNAGDNTAYLYSSGTTTYLRSGSGATLTLTANKTAIVPTSKGFNALYCTESPEVWFMDFCESKDTVDPLFLEVASKPYHFIKCEDGEYQVWGKRKHHDHLRFEQKTEEEFIANEKFLNMNKPDRTIPVELKLGNKHIFNGKESMHPHITMI